MNIASPPPLNSIDVAVPAPKRLWSGLDVAATSLLSLVFTFVLVIVPVIIMLVVSGKPDLQPNLLWLSMISFAAEAVGLIASVGLWAKFRRKYSWADIGFRPIPSRWWIYAVILTFFAAIAGGMASALMALALGQSTSTNPQLQAIAPAGFSWTAAIGMTFLGGVAVPIAEEMLFRGVIHRWASDKWGAVIGALISSLLFGLIHVIPVVIPFAFVMGLFIAYAYERTKSLWPGIVIHIINNSVKIALIYVVLATGGKLS